MTPQRILTASLDWKSIMCKAGVRFTPNMTRAVNSLTEYLCATAQTDSEDDTVVKPGWPYTADLAAEEAQE